MGGGDTSDNIVILTPREHFICHLLLTKMTDEFYVYKMWMAVRAMLIMDASAHGIRNVTMNNGVRGTSRYFEKVRAVNRRPDTDETRKRKSEAAKKRVWSDDVRRKMSEVRIALYGSKAARGKPNNTKWTVTSPNGTVYNVDNLKKFCEERGLNAGALAKYRAKGQAVQPYVRTYVDVERSPNFLATVGWQLTKNVVTYGEYENFRRSPELFA